MKFLQYTVVSVAALIIVTYNSWTKYEQFYPMLVHMASSAFNVAVLLNAACVSSVWLAKALMFAAFGQLRMIEWEHVTERGWFALSETALAMTIFRDEIGSAFVLWFTYLLIVKCFHWVLADRVDMADQMAQLSARNKPLKLFMRMCAIIGVLAAVDSLIIWFTVQDTMQYGPSMMLLFGLEFTLQLLNLSGTAGKFTLLFYDAYGRHVIGRWRNPPPVLQVNAAGTQQQDADEEDADEWEQKSMLLLLLDLSVAFWKLLAYTAFFVVVMASHGLPIHIIRDLYLTVRAFVTKVNDLIRYRRAVQSLHGTLIDVTAQDLQSAQDGVVCIICREDVTLEDLLNVPPRLDGRQRRHKQHGAKKLNCGHMFHYKCLKSWMERQQSCPTCRRSVFEQTAQQPVVVNGQQPQPAGNRFGDAVPPAAPAPAANVANVPPQLLQQHQIMHERNVHNILQYHQRIIRMQPQFQQQQEQQQQQQEVDTPPTLEADASYTYPNGVKLVPVGGLAGGAALESLSAEELDTLLSSSKQGVLQRLRMMESARAELDSSIGKTRMLLDVIGTQEQESSSSSGKQ